MIMVFESGVYAPVQVYHGVAPALVWITDLITVTRRSISITASLNDRSTTGKLNDRSTTVKLNDRDIDAESRYS